MIELRPNDIFLTDIDLNTSLFVHIDTMQIYPLEKDSEEYNFLQHLSTQGRENTQNLYGEKFSEIYQTICDTISKAPHSVCTITDTNKISFNQAILPIAGRCNLACPYCFAQTDGGFHFRDYTEKDIKDVVDFLVKQRKDEETPIVLTFFGGEPLLKFDIIKFTIGYIQQMYADIPFSYSITTNGTIVNDEIIRTIKENNIAVLLSIDGPDNEFNLRRFRNNKKSIDLVLKNIQTFKDNGVKVELRATLVSNNPYILETFKFFEDFKTQFNIVFAYNSENTSHHCAEYNHNTLQSIERQLNDVKKYYIRKIKNKEDIYNQMFVRYMTPLRYRSLSNVVCGAGWCFFTITSDGTIYPCAHFMNNAKYGIGNIHTGEIDFKKKQQYTPAYTNELQECGDCWVRNLCIGGCMSEKICTGKDRKASLGENECRLQRLVWGMYLKLYYYIMTYTPSYLIKNQNNNTNLTLC